MLDGNDQELKSPGSKLFMLALSGHDEELYPGRVLRIGGHSYVPKGEDPIVTVRAIQAILFGEFYLSVVLAYRLMNVAGGVA